MDANILIVDDNVKNLQVLGNILSKEFNSIEFATDGRKALDWISKKKFDLILLDIMMPEVDGFEVCKELQKDPAKKDVPIIFLTAKNDTESIAKGLGNGAIDYITKPFNKIELLARVHTQIKIKKANDTIKQYSQELKLKNNLINESIRYAKKIQSAILEPQEEVLKNKFNNYFIIYKPKDIVSGDFYWIKQSSHNFYIALADCTGHGIPAAFLSILNYSGLNIALEEKHLVKPDQIIKFMHEYLVEKLHKTTDYQSIKDGMDISLCVINKNEHKIFFSGANSSIYFIQNDTINEFKGDRCHVGDIYFNNFKYNSTEINYNKGDILYLMTDGFADQFGGKYDKKFKKKQLKEILKSFTDIIFYEQKEKIEEIYNEWKGMKEQTDDISIIGIQL